MNNLYYCFLKTKYRYPARIGDALLSRKVKVYMMIVDDIKSQTFFLLLQ